MAQTPTYKCGCGDRGTDPYETRTIDNTEGWRFLDRTLALSCNVCEQRIVVAST